MLEYLKQLFCFHNYIDKCRVRCLDGKNYQDLCSSRKHNNNCKRHNSKNELIGGNCDYYYQECTRCGKTKFIDF